MKCDDFVPRCSIHSSYALASELGGVSQVGRHVFYRLKRMPEDLLKGEGMLVAMNGGGAVYH